MELIELATLYVGKGCIKPEIIVHKRQCPYINL